MNHFTPFLPAGALPALRDLGMPRMPVRTQRHLEFWLLAVIAVSLGMSIARMI
ncbi:hypothetical protein [Rhizobium sp. BK602]|uniref:hypothetical protein n=1 Tax=Rhizobium sp. BK602 TaxID=2586986 RepID=UPI0016081D5B|nr:hypothetical protein [Rhizobium sp. BK602]MBB3608633.1 hypothetical protein [Rhizobium sp. BK602]